MRYKATSSVPLVLRFPLRCISLVRCYSTRQALIPLLLISLVVSLGAYIGKISLPIILINDTKPEILSVHGDMVRALIFTLLSTGNDALPASKTVLQLR